MVAPDSLRKQMVDAAEQLFAKQGYLETSVAQIIAQAGAAKGTFYHHFGSKEALMDAIIERHVSHLREQVEAAVAAPSPSPLQRFLGLFSGGVRHREHSAEISGELAERGNELMHLRALDATAKALHEPVVALLRQAREQGEIECEHPEAAAAVFLVIVGQLVDRDLFGWVEARDAARLQQLLAVGEQVIGAPDDALSSLFSQSPETGGEA